MDRVIARRAETESRPPEEIIRRVYALPPILGGRPRPRRTTCAPDRPPLRLSAAISSVAEASASSASCKVSSIAGAMPVLAAAISGVNVPCVS